MKRIWKIYRLLAAQNLKRIMEYRADFLTGAVSFLIDQAIGIAFIFIIFTQIPQLAGFTFEQILFIYGFSQIPKGLDHLLADNLWCVGYFIVRKGDFDKYLNNYTSPLLICSINFILCIPYTKYQGQFFLELIDRYISFLPIVFIVLYEISI